MAITLYLKDHDQYTDSLLFCIKQPEIVCNFYFNFHSKYFKIKILQQNIILILFSIDNFSRKRHQNKIVIIH